MLGDGKRIRLFSLGSEVVRETETNRVKDKTGNGSEVSVLITGPRPGILWVTTRQNFFAVMKV